MKIVSKASSSIKVMTYEMHILHDRCYDTLSLDRNTITRCSGVASESLPHSRLMQHSKRSAYRRAYRSKDLRSRLKNPTCHRSANTSHLQSRIADITCKRNLHTFPVRRISMRKSGKVSEEWNVLAVGVRHDHSTLRNENPRIAENRIRLTHCLV